MLVPYGGMAIAMQRSKQFDGFKATTEWWNLTASPSQLERTSAGGMEAKDQGRRGREMLERLGVGIPGLTDVAPAAKV